MRGAAVSKFENFTDAEMEKIFQLLKRKNEPVFVSQIYAELLIPVGAINVYLSLLREQQRAFPIHKIGEKNEDKNVPWGYME